MFSAFSLIFFSCDNDNKDERLINDGVKETERPYNKNSLDDDNIMADREEDLNSEINSPGMDKMYNDLEMTDEQIYRFEKEYNSAIKGIKDSNQDMVEKEKRIEQKQDQILKSVLSDDQFNDYNEWKERNK